MCVFIMRMSVIHSLRANRVYTHMIFSDALDVLLDVLFCFVVLGARCKPLRRGLKNTRPRASLSAERVSKNNNTCKSSRYHKEATAAAAVALTTTPPTVMQNKKNCPFDKWNEIAVGQF